MNTSNFNSSRPKRPRTSMIPDENDDSIQAQLEAMKTENAKLNKKLEVQQKSILDLVYEKTELKSNQSNNNGIDEDMKEELERLKESEKQSKAVLDETQTKMENEKLKYEDEIIKLNLVINAHTAEINKLKEKTSVLKDVKVEFGTNNDDLKDAKKENEATINKMKSEIDDLKQKNAEAEKAHNWIVKTKDKEILKLETQLSFAIGGKQELTNKNVSVNNQLASLKKTSGAKIADLTKKNSAYEAKISDLKSEIEDLKKKNDDSKAEVEAAHELIVDTKDNVIAELQQQLLSSNHVRNELTTKNTELENTRKTLEAKITELLKKNSVNETNITILRRSVENLKKKKTELEKEITRLNLHEEDLIIQKAESKSTLEKAHRLIVETKDNEIAELNNQLLIANTAKDELTTKMAAAEVQHEKNEKKLKAKYIELSKKNSANEAKMADSKTEIENHKKKITVLESRVNDLTKKNSKCEENYKNAEKYSNGYVNKIQAMKKEQEKIQDECEKKIKQNAEETAAKCQKTFDDMNTNRQKEIEEYKKMNTELENKLKTMRSETGKRFTELEKREAEANTVIKDQQTTIQELKDQLKQAKEAFSENDERQKAMNLESFWMYNCRLACAEVFNQQAKDLLRKNKDGNIDEILKKFEEKEYKSPNEFLDSLTKLIQNCSYTYRRRTQNHQLLDSLNQSLNDKFKPIIEMFIGMKDDH